MRRREQFLDDPRVFRVSTLFNAAHRTLLNHTKLFYCPVGSETHLAVSRCHCHHLFLLVSSLSTFEKVYTHGVCPHDTHTDTGQLELRAQTVDMLARKTATHMYTEGESHTSRDRASLLSLRILILPRLALGSILDKLESFVRRETNNNAFLLFAE